MSDHALSYADTAPAGPACLNTMHCSGGGDPYSRCPYPCEAIRLSCI